MNEFNLATANKRELKTYAKNTYELDLTMNMHETTMRRRIVEHCDHNGLDSPVSEINTKQDLSDRKQDKVVKRVIVNIPKSDKPGGTEPVQVGLQGVLYTIPRGIDIAVSPAIEEVLRNAITDNVIQEGGDGEIIHNEVPTYPYSVRPA